MRSGKEGIEEVKTRVGDVDVEGIACDRTEVVEGASDGVIIGTVELNDA